MDIWKESITEIKHDLNKLTWSEVFDDAIKVFILSLVIFLIIWLIAIPILASWYEFRVNGGSYMEEWRESMLIVLGQK